VEGSSTAGGVDQHPLSGLLDRLCRQEAVVGWGRGVERVEADAVREALNDLAVHHRERAVCALAKTTHSFTMRS
jgi:hypothetical protein